MKEFYSVTEAARILSISREAVLKQITTGKLRAIKIGRNYAIPGFEITWEDEDGVELTFQQKNFLDHTVKRAMGQYSQLFELLQNHTS